MSAAETMNPIEAAQALPATRFHAESAFLAARRRGDISLPEIDGRWRQVEMVRGQPAAAQMCALVGFEKWLGAETERLDRERREAAAGAAAAAAERHAHALDGIADVYACKTSFMRMVDGTMLSFKDGAILRDRNLVAKLIAAGAPLDPVDEDELLTCASCGHEFRRRPFRPGMEGAST
jgi:hypothetical protein